MRTDHPRSLHLRLLQELFFYSGKPEYYLSLLFLSFGFKFYKVDGQVKSFYFILSILLSFIISFVIATKVTFKTKKLNKIYLISTSIILVLGSYLSLELLNRQSLMHFSIIRIILNLGLIIVPTIIAFIYSNNTKKSLLIGTIFPYLLGIINYISVLQDNTPFILFRTFSIMPTGGMVNAIISYQLVLATFTTLLIVLLIRNINYEIKPIDLSKITKIIDFKPIWYIIEEALMKKMKILLLIQLLIVM